jgi:hypothetical protein
VSSLRRHRNILSSAAYAASGKARLAIVPPSKKPFDILLTDSTTRPLPPANHNLTASAAKAGVTGKWARFGWVMLQGCGRTCEIDAV